MATPIVRLVLYVKNIPAVAAFYREHFGFVPLPSDLSGWQELVSPSGGCSLALHQAAKSQKSGAAVKLVFAVPNVKQFIADRAAHGLAFGPIHDATGYCFANAKDPAGNSISISDRGYHTAPS